MSDTNKKDEIKQVPDSELTPAQLKKREKNRANRAKKRAKEDAKKDDNINLATEQPAQNKAIEKRLSFEEREQQMLEKKSAKVERNVRDSVVILAETAEARSLAYKVDEINRITDFTRSFMGTDKVSFKVGQDLLEMFNDSILGTLDTFMELAAKNNIGSRWTLEEYNKEQKIIKNKMKKAAEKRDRFISNENAAEKKARETREKLLEKAELDVAIAKEALATATATLNNQQSVLDEISKTYADQFADSISLQNERIKAEKEKAEKEKAENEAETTTEVAKPTKS